MSKSGKEKNEIFTSQACGSTIMQSQIGNKKDRRTGYAGRNHAKDHCTCYEVFQINRRRVKKSYKDVSGTPESGKDGAAWKNYRVRTYGTECGSLQY